MNRYLYADGDPVNNIDPDGHLPKWLQRGWKATKKWAKKGYNFAIGDDIRTLKSPKSKWYHKAGAAASLASNFIPGAGAVKWGVKAVKYGKKMKKSRKFAAASIKKMRKAKLKAKASRARIKPKLRRPVSGDNVGVNLRAKGTGKLGRKGKQARLRELANDDKLSSALRGEIRRDINEIKRGKRKNIRVPKGYELAHRRGYEARKGYGYEYSDLQIIRNHRTQHKYDGYGRRR